MVPSKKIIGTRRAMGRHRPRLHALAPLVVLAITFVIVPAAAAPLPRLVVVRASDVTDCPDALALAVAVAQQMQRPALDPTDENPTTTVYEVRIVRSADGYAATIQAGDLTRDLSDPGSTCAELGEALALTLTILLDDELSSPPPEPLPETPPLPEPLPETPLPPALPRPTPLLLPKIHRPAKPVRDWKVEGELGVGQAINFLSPLSFAFFGNAWLRYRAASFGAGVFTVPSDSVDVIGVGTVVMRLVTGSLHACGRIAGRPTAFHVSLCGQSFLGAVNGQGERLVVNREGTGPWLALGGMALFERPLVGRWGLSARVSLAVPVVSQRFTATHIQGSGANIRETPITLFEPEKLTAFLGVGIRWTIF